MSLFGWLGGAKRARPTSKMRKPAPSKPAGKWQKGNASEERKQTAAIVANFKKQGGTFEGFVKIVQELLDFYDSPSPIQDVNTSIYHQNADFISIAEMIIDLEDGLGVSLALDDDELVEVSIRDLAEKCGLKGA